MGIWFYHVWKISVMYKRLLDKLAAQEVGKKIA